MVVVDEAVFAVFVGEAAEDVVEAVAGLLKVGVDYVVVTVGGFLDDAGKFRHGCAEPFGEFVSIFLFYEGVGAPVVMGVVVVGVFNHHNKVEVGIIPDIDVFYHGLVVVGTENEFQQEQVVVFHMSGCIRRGIWIIRGCRRVESRIGFRGWASLAP